jgi:uncharacterized membrane protein YeaQ/YmgE (transglycosylase-associated protein family)
LAEYRSHEAFQSLPRTARIHPRERATGLAQPAIPVRRTGRLSQRRLKLKELQISTESLLVILIIGLIAGWLAGQIVQGTGLGIIGDLVVGIVGAVIGSWLLPQLHVVLGSGLLAEILNATIGAILLLVVIKLIRGGGRSWRRR